MSDQQLTESVEFQVLWNSFNDQKANVTKSGEDALASLEVEIRKNEEAYLRNLQDPKANKAWLDSLKENHRLRQSKIHNRKTTIKVAIGKLSELDTLWQIVAIYIDENKSALAIKRRQMEYRDSYGNLDSKQWQKEINNFLDSNPTVRLMLDKMNQLSRAASSQNDWIEFTSIMIDSLVEPVTTSQVTNRRDGIQFEQDCLEQLTQLGWSVITTPASTDHGADLIAKKSGLTIAIQCKNHQKPIGNTAIQEAYSGKSFYEADHAAVVSISGFTRAATQLAQKLGVLLLDSAELSRVEELANRH